MSNITKKIYVVCHEHCEAGCESEFEGVRAYTDKAAATAEARRLNEAFDEECLSDDISEDIKEIYWVEALELA